ncbi:MAG: tRNA (adenosine(37)-N6)-threonylcarbamoyltransferase complex dimerization subunit type 1 TsaB [Clostridia bacterium]|nr:tRNA (adenosine(37)-N6)-threonylcarbamoyltransferase complex dimerization subunit type 1 TsaB [Clostridia bacterium]
MNILALDTSAEKIVLSLFANDKKDYYIGQGAAKKHNSELLIQIDSFLKRNGLTVEELDVIGVVVGPGSFTGIRIGVATANALAKALSKKIIEVTSLELPVEDAGRVLVALDCKHDNYYCGLFENDTVEYQPLTRSEIDSFDGKVLFLNGAYEKELLEKVLTKTDREEFSSQAKPFYMKRSSAERETGILC